MKLGATGKFPKGKLNSNDKGELMTKISHDENMTVKIEFGKKIAWIAFDRKRAIEFAFTILRHAGLKNIYDK